MSTKALKKELMAAVVMLLVAAIALSGSTYAWFAKNNQVTAEEMEVTAKSDMAFLLIAAGNKTYAQVQATPTTSVAALSGAAALYPTAHVASVAKTSDADTATNWYYCYNGDASQSKNNIVETTTLAAADLPDYVLINEFTLTVAQGSNAVKNINCDATIQSTSASAVKVLVTTDNNFEEFSNTGGEGAVDLMNGLSLNDTSALHVKVYIYWDGNDDDVYTNNIANLLGTSVTLTFAGDVVE